MNKYLPYGLIVIALIAGIVINTYVYQDIDEDTGAQSNLSQNTQQKIDNRFETLLIYPKKNKLPAFQMIDQHQQIFTNEQFAGLWSLIFIGYTNCPDVCPNTLNQMTQLYNQLDPSLQQKFQFVLLSVDPKRDTPEHLQKYLSYFHDDFIGISGNKDQIDKTVKALGGVYSISQEEGDFYTVDHSSRIFIVGPEARRYGILESSSLASADKSKLINDLTQMSQ